MTSTLLASALTGVLPYVQVPELGPIKPFGVLVVTGILVGAKIAGIRAEKAGIERERFSNLVFWTVLTGIVLSHVLDTLFYYPHVVLERPWELLMVWRGLSSFGGFFGAIVGFVAYSRKYDIPMWKAADAIAYGLPFGWFFGRMGCAVVHDHPGIRSDAWYAVAFPGGPRLDLGLMEMALTPLLILAVVLVGRRARWPGAIVATLAIVYPFIRFPLDFLRAPLGGGGDIRYLGLTPGHYASILLLALGLFLWYRSRHAASAGAAAPHPAAARGSKRAARRA